MGGGDHHEWMDGSVPASGCGTTVRRSPLYASSKARKEKEMENQETATSKKPMTKTQIVAALSEASDLTKQQVTGLLDELAKLIGKNLGQDGPGEFAVPGLMKIKVIRKPATEERKGINPFTKEETVFKAKPARNAVKVIALKGLKDMV